jgi:hypothetical protein
MLQRVRLSCDRIAHIVGSFGIYRPMVLENGIDGTVLMEYSTLNDIETEAFFIELN